MAGRHTLIAVYDLDRTVTFRPTYSLFLLQSAFRLNPLRLLLGPVAALAMLAHALKLLSRDRLKAAMWALMLGPVDPDRLKAVVDAFARRTLETNIRPGARREIARDRAEGAFLVLATASHELYARPIAEALGFEGIVATQAIVGEDRRIGPRLASANVYGDSKLAALVAFLDDLEVGKEGPHIRFYSDSSSDRPVFEWADRPFAVNPSRRLRRLAAEKGWPILDWGRPAH